MPVEKYGLRLALRDGYLNFYRHGQSVAKTWVNASDEPVSDIHVKYALGPWDAAEYSKLKRHYAHLKGNSVYHKETGKLAEYGGIETLRRWIEKADEHKGAEKTFVDDVVKHNSSIIDLEMGLPAWTEEKVAPRMDMVALEAHADAVDIVFWEAKLIRNGELVSRTAPKVIGQLEKYVEFLADIKRRGHVVVAYRNTCCILTELHKMAKLLHQQAGDGIRLPDLDILVKTAAKPDSDLQIDCKPRLAIFDHNKSRSTNWAIHEKKLRDLGVPVRVFDDPPDSLRLQELAA